MVKQEASDLYLTVDAPPVYRIHGSTHRTDAPPFTNEQLESLALALMRGQQRGEFEEKMEMNLALYYKDLGRFRVNVFRQKGNVGLVFRHIKADIMTIEQLELPPIIKDIAMTKRGLVLVVGATGSGKSTTLAAMIDHRNSVHAGHIISVEDPIEFVHHHKKSIITQREVGFDTHTFGSALRNTLRQAPDVILIGEIRDTETMEAAITFAETGHLCLGTLHSNNANQAIERIMNFFPVERTPRSDLFAVEPQLESHHFATADSIRGRETRARTGNHARYAPHQRPHQEGRSRYLERSDGAGDRRRLSDIRSCPLPAV
jgi:twitching motility protein PilU